MPRLAALLVVALLMPSAVHAACAVSCAWPASRPSTASAAAATCHQDATLTDAAALAAGGTTHCQDDLAIAPFAPASRWMREGGQLSLSVDPESSSGASTAIHDACPESPGRLQPPMRAGIAPLRV